MRQKCFRDASRFVTYSIEKIENQGVRLVKFYSFKILKSTQLFENLQVCNDGEESEYSFASLPRFLQFVSTLLLHLANFNIKNPNKVRVLL